MKITIILHAVSIWFLLSLCLPLSFFLRSVYLLKVRNKQHLRDYPKFQDVGPKHQYQNVRGLTSLHFEFPYKYFVSLINAAASLPAEIIIQSVISVAQAMQSQRPPTINALVNQTFQTGFKPRTSWTQRTASPLRQFITSLLRHFISSRLRHICTSYNNGQFDGS